VYVVASNRRCRSCRSLKIFMVLFYKDFAPTALGFSLGRVFKIIGDAVFEEKAGWRVVPIIGRDEGASPSWGCD
jgi:hypothetical protein